MDPELCSQFTRDGLVFLTSACNKSSTKRDLPLTSKLLLLKVVAQVGARGVAAGTVHTEKALGREGLEELLSVVVLSPREGASGAGGKWLKHALLCMLMELAEAEAEVKTRVQKSREPIVVGRDG